MKKNFSKAEHVFINEKDITRFATQVCILNQKFENTALRNYANKNTDILLSEATMNYLEQRTRISEDFAKKLSKDISLIDSASDIGPAAKEIAEEIARLFNGNSPLNIPFSDRIDKMINDIETEWKNDPDDTVIDNINASDKIIIDHLIQLKTAPDIVIRYFDKLFKMAEACGIPGIRKRENESAYFAMLHGKATDAVATMAGKKYNEDEVTNKKTFTSNEVSLVVNNNLNQLAGTLGISTHKLLSTAIGIFTANNNTGNGKRDLKALRVNIPLKEYAIKRGYNVTEKPTNTPEEQEREKKRAQNALKEARKQINKDLDLLFNATISWKEMVKNKEQNYLDIRIISSKGVIRNGMIHIGFSPEIGEYLLQLPLTQYPTALLSLDERAANAYNIGLKMSEHYNNDNNQIRGTAQILKVKTLLKYTNFPEIETVRAKRKSWKERILDPFNDALGKLEDNGLLSDWYYCKNGGVMLTDEKASDFNSYEEWAEVSVHYTLKDPPDHTIRLEIKTEEKNPAVKKRKSEKNSEKNS